jgi:hypothetical protein
VGGCNLSALCSDLLADAQSLSALMSEVSRRIGYPVTTVQMDVDHPDLSGLCYVVDDRVIIASPTTAPRWFQRVAICHELAHLALGHLMLPTGFTRRGVAPTPALAPAGAPPGPSDQEHSAELLGSLLAARIEPHSTAATITAGDLRLLQRHHTYLRRAVPDMAVNSPDDLSSAQDRWLVMCLIVAITDVRRSCLGHVPLALASLVADRVGDHGLHPWQARVATDQVSLKLGMTARASSLPPPDSHPPAWLPGEDCLDAARRAARQLRIAEDPTVAAIISTVHTEFAGAAPTHGGVSGPR